jgi:hypothetical protein
VFSFLEGQPPLNCDRAARLMGAVLNSWQFSSNHKILGLLGHKILDLLITIYRRKVLEVIIMKKSAILNTGLWFLTVACLIAPARDAFAAGCSDVDNCASNTCKVSQTTYNCRSGQENEYKLEGFPPKLVTYTFATCQCPAGRNPKKYRKQIPNPETTSMDDVNPNSAGGGSVSGTDVQVVEGNGSVSALLSSDPACE